MDVLESSFQLGVGNLTCQPRFCRLDRFCLQDPQLSISNMLEENKMPFSIAEVSV